MLKYLPEVALRIVNTNQTPLTLILSAQASHDTHNQVVNPRPEQEFEQRFGRSVAQDGLGLRFWF